MHFDLDANKRIRIISNIKRTSIVLLTNYQKKHEININNNTGYINSISIFWDSTPIFNIFSK